MGWKDTIKKEPKQKEEKKSSWRDTITVEESNDTLQNVADSWASFKEGVPGGGLMQKASSAGAAGINQLVDLFSDRPDKSFSEHYASEQALDEKEKQAREKRTPIGTTIGDIGGTFLAPNPASIAGRMSLNIADQATRANSMEELKDRSSTAALTSAVFESIPIAGKFMKKAFSKPAQAVAASVPAREAAEEVMESGLKKIAGDSVSIPQMADEVAEASSLKALSGGPEHVLKTADKASVSDRISTYLKEKFGPMAKKGLGLLTNSDDEMMARYAADPKFVNAARATDELAADALGNVDKLRDRVVKGSREATELISDEVAVPSTQLIDRLRQLRAPLSESYTDTGEAAKNEINRIIKRLNNEIKVPEIPSSGLEVDLNKMMFVPPEKAKVPELSGQKLKKFIKNLDAEIDYADRAGEIMTPASQAKLEFRKYLDSILKDSSPEYAAAMEKVAKDAEALDVARKMFGKQDATASRLKSAANRPKDKREVREALANLDERSGTTLLKENDARKVQDYFNEDLSGGRGPRNRLIGGVIGGTIGSVFGPVGATAGAVAGGKAGQYLDSHGRKIAKSVMDFTSNPESFNFLSKMESKVQNMAPRYQQALSEAAKRGGNAMAVTHFLLGSQNPDYQQYFQDEEEE